MYPVLGEEVHAQYFFGWKLISIEGIALENFKNFRPSTVPMALFNFHLLYGSYKYSSITATHLDILISSLIYKSL